MSKGTSLRFEFKLEEYRGRPQEILARVMDELAAKLADLKGSAGNLAFKL